MLTKERERYLNKNIELNKLFGIRKIGSCMKILKEYKASHKQYSQEGFRDYYYKNMNKLPALTSIKEIIMSLGFTTEEAREYIDLRLVRQTYKGLEMEVRAFDYLKKNHKLPALRFATHIEDIEDFIDLVDDVNMYAFQVKPISYKLGSNASLLKDRAVHNHRYRELKHTVFFIYYHNNKFKIEKAI